MTLLSSALLAAFAQDLPPIEALVAAERAFAADSEAHGMKVSFLGAFAEDAVAFHPGAVEARKWTSEHEDLEGWLEWTPTVAGVSTDGRFGWTSGPWSYGPKAADAPRAAFGRFLSVWALRDGVWKVVLDVGVDLPEGPQHPSKGATDYTAVAPPAAAISGDVEAVLRVADKSRALLASDVTVLRPGVAPAGGAAAVGILGSEAAPATWSQDGFRLAGSSDLAATWGHFDGGNYVRIWTANPNGTWTVRVDLRGP